MSAEDFEICRKCGGAMKRLSPEDSSPLIMECEDCKHREYAEIQIVPPWPPRKEKAEPRDLLHDILPV